MSNFKVIFTAVFIGAAIFGILVFAGYINLGGSSATTAPKGSVTIWGTFPDKSIEPFIGDFNLRNHDINIKYVQQDPATFDSKLVEAIATGHTPDLVLLPDNLVWRFGNKMQHIPFASLPASTFQSTFASGGNIFSVSDGTLAIPWVSDPLVLYYNRDLLESAGIAQPPATWDDFDKSIPLLARKESDLTLTQMATALGAYKNLAHGKEIVALLFQETGNPIITPDGSGFTVHIGSQGTTTEQAGAAQALQFFMSFSDPLKQIYTWNAGQPLDRDVFIQSNLAYYFGTASELPLIRAQNPNLNFGVALPPQGAVGASLTSGHVYGLGIPNNASDQLLSYTAATLLANADSENALITTVGTTLSLMPVRRDVLAEQPANDPYLGFLFKAALVQKSWLDPNPAESDQIFADMIHQLSSSSLSPYEALGRASAELGALSVIL